MMFSRVSKPWVDMDDGPLSSTVVVQYLETGVGEEESLTALQSEKCPQETVRAIFAGIHTVLTAALKQPSLKAAVGVHDYSLVQPLVQPLVSLVPRPHPKIGKGAWCHLQRFPYVLCQQSLFGVEESRPFPIIITFLRALAT